MGHLGEHLVAGHHRHLEAGAAGELGVVAGIVADGGTVRGEDGVEVKRLRRLHAHDAGARRGIAQHLDIMREAVDDGQHGHGAGQVVERVQ